LEFPHGVEECGEVVCRKWKVGEEERGKMREALRDLGFGGLFS